MGKQWKQWETLFSWAPKSLQMLTAAMKLKDACSLEKKQWKPMQCIKQQRHYFANKGPYKAMGLSRSHVQMWELDHKEGWAPKNWCFWTAVLEKTLIVPWTARRSNQSILKEINPEFIGETNPEAPVFWPTNTANSLEKTLDAGKDWRQEEKEVTGWDGWIASLTQWTWVWANSRK